MFGLSFLMWWLKLPIRDWALAILAPFKQGRTLRRDMTAPLASDEHGHLPEKAQPSPKELFIWENEIVADAKTALLKLYQRHPLVVVRDESAHIVLTFTALCQFAEQRQTKKLPALLKDLDELIPGTDISPIRRNQKAQLAKLKSEIAALMQLQNALTELAVDPDENGQNE
jgi:hypothetical protein